MAKKGKGHSRTNSSKTKTPKRTRNRMKNSRKATVWGTFGKRSVRRLKRTEQRPPDLQRNQREKQRERKCAN